MVEISSKLLIFLALSVLLYLFIVDTVTKKKEEEQKKPIIADVIENNVVFEVSNDILTKVSTKMFSETIGHSVTDLLKNSTQVFAATISGTSLYLLSIFPVCFFNLNIANLCNILENL